MKTKFSAVLVAAVITATSVNATTATAQEPNSQGTSSFSSASSEDSSSEGAVIASLALLAAVGGGAYWAVQEGLIPSPLPGIIPIPVLTAPAPAPTPAPPRGDCAPQAFNEALWEWNGSPRTVVEYCDGKFAWVAQSQTDWRVAFEFNGRSWEVLRADGTTKTGMMQGCYNGLALRDKGATDAFISRLPICTPDEIGYSPW